VECWQGGVVGIATGYGLDGPRIESRWEARFSVPVQTDPRAHPVSCKMGTRSFQGVKSGRGVTLTPHALLVPWSRKSRDIALLSLWAVRSVQSFSGIYLSPFPCGIRSGQWHWAYLMSSRFSSPYSCSCSAPNVGCTVDRGYMQT